RSTDLVVALLGVAKAGAAYVPLDPAQPAERLTRILAAVEPAVVVTRSSVLPEGSALPSVLLDDAAGLEREGPGAPGVAVPLDAPAYVLFTSGSTGFPKGVVVPHRGLANYLGWCAEAYGVAAGGGAVVHTSVDVDLTVTSLLSPLVAGGRTVLLPEAAGLEETAAALAAAEVPLFKMTPSHLDAVSGLLAGGEVRERPRVLVVGGEALPAGTLAAWWERDPRSVVVNEYGPTETVVGCCAARLGPDAAGGDPVSVGRPIANVSAYVLDPVLRPVPAGARGELHVAGAGVAAGYLALPGLTAGRFVPDPFSGLPGSRLYRTGDAVRWRLDGELEFLGRLDLQVKVRGHRVEPAEIERVLHRHPAVEEAVVIAREEGARGNRLVACLVARDGSPPAAGELRAFLQAELPDYMIPAEFVRVADVPLTPHGKVDRPALAAEAGGRLEAPTAYVAPETELEKSIAAIWKEVLRVERVGLYDNFFDLGGHSLLMVQVFSRIRAQVETELLMVELFEFPTVSAMARRLADEGGGARPLVPGRAEARLESL
ncbi:MAG TPA: non-ribosomal peptide synthetase, partial [Thermoanaerobaculia bacterium]|nr:non-ribosomal peptide synthetase [Thermoanaerobaculia bacterium]